MANISYTDVLALAKVLRSLPGEQLTQITRLAKIMGEEELLTLHEKLRSVQEKEVEAMQIGIEKMQGALNDFKAFKRQARADEATAAQAESSEAADRFLTENL